MNQFPSAYTLLLCAVEFAMGPASEVVISGRSEAEDTRRLLLESFGARSSPTKWCCFTRWMLNPRRSKQSPLTQNTRKVLTTRLLHMSA